MKKKECTGCMACYNVCPNGSIKMKRDFDGFDYPYINNSTCIKCGKCMKVCPVLQKKSMEGKRDQKSTAVYVGHSIDDKIRRTSASGGIFPLAAKWCIDKGGVVFGAKYDGVRVVHFQADGMEDIQQCQGSKYVQSYIGKTFYDVKKNLEEGRYVLFTGMPCQIEGLKAYLQRDYSKLYTIDLICHGVGAPGIWERYINTFHDKKQIEHIDFKDKKEGWNKEQFVVKYKNGREYRKFPLDDCYCIGFNKNIFLREACYHCLFKGVERSSDLTIGDAWGVEHYASKFRDNKGCSLVFVHSPKGKELFDEIEKWMKYQSVDAVKAVRYNQRMISSVKENPNRHAFYANLKRYSFWLSMHLMMMREKRDEEKLV